jgi:pimeloyl-ACP methyl ester carboxylesterase
MPVVVCVAGGSPSEHSFRDVTPLWPAHVRAGFHDISAFTGAAPPHDYTWQREVDLMLAGIDSFGAEDVYLVGFSAGATLALAAAAAVPDRVAGLGLIEPAWAFLPLSAVEQDYFAAMDGVLDLPPDQQRMAFLRLLVRPDVDLPPRDPAGDRPYQQAAPAKDTPLAVVTRAMRSHRLPPRGLAGYPGPVYLAVGGLSSPMWQAQSGALRAALPRCTVRTYPDRHHLDAPHHADAPRFVDELVAAWHLGG